MTATIRIDGRVVAAREGRDLLSACLEAGVAVPHFCWHRSMGSIGACRLCAVKVHDGPDDAAGRIEMACMTPVADGQRVAIADAEAARFRARVIEWLMVNHPHDCAVCEEGGACQLQDMLIATGHHRRRADAHKRTHRNQDLGPLLTHEMNRCIACYRCTRFYRGVAGGRDLDVFGAHDRVYFGRAEDGPLDSPFAGNLAEICPTGVFNDKGWSKAYARPWDMVETPSVCPHCSVGCNISLSVRDGRLRRAINRRHDAINGDFLCDRGRYGPLFVESPKARLTARHGQHRVSDEAAMDQARDVLRRGGAIGIGSPRASLEANFALRRLVGPERFVAGISIAEARLVAQMMAHLAAGPAAVASVGDMETADAVLVLGEDVTGTAPRAALALRQAARGAERALAAEKGVPAFLDNAVRVAGEGRRSPIAVVTALPDALDDVASWALRRAPAEIAAFGMAVAAALRGEAIDDPDAQAVAKALAAANAPLVVAGAGPGIGAIVDAAATVARALGARARLALFPPEANSFGLSLLCGGDGTGIEAVAAGDGPILVLENDLFERCAPPMVDALLAGRTVIALDCLETRITARADILLPVASFADAAGSFINHEGRAQRFFAARPERSPAAWRVLNALGGGNEADLDSLLAAMERDCPELAGVASAAPNAGFRTAMGPIARAPARFSGRTASDRAGRLLAAVPLADVDSPFGWTMEGQATDALPAGLLEGRRLDLRAAGPVADAEWPTLPDEEGLRLIPGHDPFQAGETDRASQLIAARAPAPVIRLHPADAAALGLVAGDPAAADGEEALAVVIDAGVPAGHVVLRTRRPQPRRVRPEPNR